MKWRDTALIVGGWVLLCFGTGAVFSFVAQSLSV
ncbi:hypothetical protein EV147_2689 [Cupriavidus agavae]|uniref:DUF2474 domain-containing protein n=1 Tax=Cupriavidus agavae TaxID=1001822 RepID=A0A4Q7S050_9BURK|nr:hypothetical protein EV147_2689 [Cupriavidus agavae]